MDQEKIGQFIKKIRNQQKLSQQKFAEKYGVTYQAVSKWETGKNIPDLSILKQMCQEYHMNLDDFLETKIPKKKTKMFFILPLLLFPFIIGIIIINNNDKNHFELKGLSTTCDNFNLYGSIAYNSNKTSIYISNITYCGEETYEKYKIVECSLYELNGKTKTEISRYNYSEEKEITLDEFLKNVKFNVDHYEKTCKLYKENSLHLEIYATNQLDEITTYKIPLKLEEDCIVP